MKRFILSILFTVFIASNIVCKNQVSPSQPRKILESKLYKRILQRATSYKKSAIAICLGLLALAIIKTRKFYSARTDTQWTPRPPLVAPTTTESELTQAPTIGNLNFDISNASLNGIELSQTLKVPGKCFVENCWNGSNLKPGPVFTIAPGTTISRECIISMSENTQLCLNPRVPSLTIDDCPIKNLKPEQKITAQLFALATARVLIEKIGPRAYQVKQGNLDLQRPILVFGISAIKDGNDPESMACHKQMLKNIFDSASKNGITKLAIIPPGGGVFGVNKKAIIEAMRDVILELKAQDSNFRLVLYLNALGEEIFAKEVFNTPDLAQHLCLIPGADILLMADCLAQRDKQEPNAPPTVGVVDLLNPDALSGKCEWNFGYHPCSLSAQGMSAFTTVETASQTRNPSLYQDLRSYRE